MEESFHQMRDAVNNLEEVLVWQKRYYSTMVYILIQPIKLSNKLPVGWENCRAWEVGSWSRVRGQNEGQMNEDTA